MRSLTVDECDQVSGGLMKYEDWLKSGGFAWGGATSSESGAGGNGIFVTTDANGVETVWAFASKDGGSESSLCEIQFTLAGNGLGWLIGKNGGVWLGGLAGGAVGFVAMPVVGPAGPAAGTFAGIVVGREFGGKFGFWAGGVAGATAGAYACNSSPTDEELVTAGPRSMFRAGPFPPRRLVV